jgi:hypothetical protein
VTVKHDFQQLKDKIQAAIKNLSPNTEEKIDYEIFGNTEQAQDIEVKANLTSRRLTGSFKINVVKASINDQKISDANVLMNDGELRTLIEDKINQLIVDLHVKENVDYRLEVDKELNHVTVTALPDSQWITGTMNFDLSKIKLDQLGTKVDLSIPFLEDSKVVEKKVEILINQELLTKNGEQRATINLNDFDASNSNIPNV